MEGNSDPSNPFAWTMSKSKISNMKKSLALLITLAFIGPSLSVPAFAAVKAGATCKTMGEIKTVSGFKYTCTKSGKKLTWNKGVAIKMPTPTPQKIIFRPWATQFETELMIRTALDSTNNYFGKVVPDSKYEIFIDKELPESDRIWIAKMLDYSNGAFKSLENKEIKVFAGTSHEWSKSTLSSMNLWMGSPGGPYPCSDGKLDVLCVDKNLILLITKNPSQTYWTVLYRSAPAHEFFHTIQYFLTGPQFTVHGGPMTDLSSKRIPRWLIEGSANYFGYYMVEKMGFYSYQQGRRIQVELNYTKDYSAPLSEHDYLANPTLDPYGIGQAATEYIIASVGFESLLNIFKYTNSEGNFSAGFKKATGIEINDFYSKFEEARSSFHIGP